MTMWKILASVTRAANVSRYPISALPETATAADASVGVALPWAGLAGATGVADPYPPGRPPRAAPRAPWPSASAESMLPSSRLAGNAIDAASGIRLKSVTGTMTERLIAAGTGVEVAGMLHGSASTSPRFLAEADARTSTCYAPTAIASRLSTPMSSPSPLPTARGERL